MKFYDTMKLVLNEFRYEKMEWIISVVLQWFIFASILFLVTLTCAMDQICNEYMRPLYLDGYDFVFKGYSENEIDELKAMGFKDISFSNEGKIGYGIAETLDGIWIKKIMASFKGRDIWNERLDEALGVMFFCQIIFIFLSLVMFIIMINNISNSFAMKILRRRKYIYMLCQLGLLENLCKLIFFCVFIFRSAFSFILALFTNEYILFILNKYMREKMYISEVIVQCDFSGVCIVALVSGLFLLWMLKKQWRQINEDY